MSEGPVDTGAPSRSDWRPRANPWAIAVAVTSAAFMEILDTTIVNVALPHIAGSLSVGADEATWTLTSYLVANGIVLPISGWLGSVLGRKRYFMICIAMFTVCSLLCGLATSLPQLVIFRVMQGFFGGGLQPNQQSIILDTFPPAKRGAAFSVTAVATSGRRWAGSSPTISAGAGSSSSTCRSVSPPSSPSLRWSRIRPGPRSRHAPASSASTISAWR
jgi:DHA2 family multidrug resistance protein